MPRTERLSSPANPLLKEIRRAVARGEMVDGRLCIAEGFHLLKEALRSRVEIGFVLAAESAEAEVAGLAGRLSESRILILPDTLFQTIATTESSQGVIALAEPPETGISDLLRNNALLVILDGVQDPGNAGAVVRAAEAFQASGVIFLKGSVSPWNPKALRAAAGSSFRVPVAAGLEAATVTNALRQNRIQIWAAMPWTPRTLPASDADLAGPSAIVIGSEGRGISEGIGSVSRSVAIPTSAVESLNAATAAAILLYEARRQRGSAKVAS